MSRAEVLSQLKQSEEEAKQRRAKAEEEAKKIVAAAHVEASSIIDAAKNKAIAEADALIKNDTARIQGEANVERSEGEKQAAALKTSAKAKVGAATDYLTGEFERYVNARTSTHG